MDRLLDFPFMDSYSDFNSEHFDSVLRSMRLYVYFHGVMLPLKYLGVSLYLDSVGSLRPLFSFKFKGNVYSLTMASVLLGRLLNSSIYYILKH